MGKTLFNVLSIAGSIVTIVMVIPVIMASNEHKQLYLSVYLVSVFIFFAICISIYYKSAVLRYIRYLFSKSGNYLVLVRETRYEFLSRTEMYHEKKYKIQSKINDLQELNTRFGWSKEKDLTPIPIINSHSIAKTWKSDKMIYFTILFDRHYRKNEVLTTGFKLTNLEDPNKESQLYLSTGIFEKTKLVRLILKFEKTLIPKNIEIKIYKKYFDLSPIFHESLEYDFENREVVFEHDYPLKLSKYMITWEFE